MCRPNILRKHRFLFKKLLILILILFLIYLCSKNLNIMEKNSSEQIKLTANFTTEEIIKDDNSVDKSGAKALVAMLKRLEAASHSNWLTQDTDRIVEQLFYIPKNYEAIRKTGKFKSILLYNNYETWRLKMGRDIFQRLNCPVDTCEITTNRSLAESADMIIYKEIIKKSKHKATNQRQVTLYYNLESPRSMSRRLPNGINWTATYRRDSDIVAPYAKWIYYTPKMRQMKQERNYAENKTKKVAWLVTHCATGNKRLQYAKKLQKYIEVDIYGKCGNLNCSRQEHDKCLAMLERDYKFYLAFENSNCHDYISEKFYVNALEHNILPIVMGARPEEYALSAPHNSYIHVNDFNTTQELAEYLKILDRFDELYNAYFEWKGTGEFINTYFWCRLCAVLHNESMLDAPRWYTHFGQWFNGKNVCYKSQNDFDSKHYMPFVYEFFKILLVGYFFVLYFMLFCVL